MKTLQEKSKHFKKKRQEKSKHFKKKLQFFEVFTFFLNFHFFFEVSPVGPGPWTQSSSRKSLDFVPDPLSTQVVILGWALVPGLNPSQGRV